MDEEKKKKEIKKEVHRFIDEVIDLSSEKLGNIPEAEKEYIKKLVLTLVPDTLSPRQAVAAGIALYLTGDVVERDLRDKEGTATQIALDCRKLLENKRQGEELSTEEIGQIIKKAIESLTEEFGLKGEVKILKEDPESNKHKLKKPYFENLNEYFSLN